jgi:hypothetical protein
MKKRSSVDEAYTRGILISDAEVRDFWKSCYIAAVVAGVVNPAGKADIAVDDYYSAMDYLGGVNP